MPYPYTPTGYGQNLPYSFDYQNSDTHSDNFTRTAEWLPYLIQGQLGGLASQGISNLYNSAPAYDNARLNAITMLGAGAQQGLVDTYRRRAMSGAGDQGRQTAAMLRSQGILGADAAAGLDAQNHAAMASNAYAQQVYDPAAQAQRYSQQMQLSSPQAVFPLLQMILALDQSSQNRTNANNQMHAQSGGSGLGGILGNILGLATGGGLGNLRSLFGGGQGSQPPEYTPGMGDPGESSGPNGWIWLPGYGMSE